MATAADTRRPLLPAGRADPMVDIGIAPPRVRWSLTHEDRKKGVIIAGGQGSGKTATLAKRRGRRAVAEHRDDRL